MFERFTERARRIMTLANQEAVRHNHNYIGTEHVLLALISEGGGAGVEALKEMGADLTRTKAEVEKLIKTSRAHDEHGKLPHTPYVKTAIMYAVEESHQLGQDSVDTGHLLLGLIRQQEGLAAKALAFAGVELERAREVVKSLAAEGG